jgi:hypothetical protein
MLAALALSLVLVQDPVPNDPVAFDRDALIAEAIGLVRPVAFRSAQADWTAIETDMRRRSEGARDSVDMLPAYAALTYGLGDGHSFIQPTQEAAAGWTQRHGEGARLLPDTPRKARPTSTFVGREGVSHRVVPVASGRTAQLVVVPSVSGAGAPARAYASDLFTAIADAGPQTCGYVLDLRGNTGGNVWPMLTGLSPLLGDGPAGRSVDASGNVEHYAELREGSAIVLAEEGRGLTMMTAASWRPTALTQTPVALLLDDGVFSSGEGVAVAFKGRAHTRFFGRRTGGLASSNNGYTLSDGTNLVITIAMMMDRDGSIYPHGIDPDQVVDAGDGDMANAEDAVVEAATTWLAQQPGCRP